MAKRKEGFLDVLVSLPWPVGLVAGIVAYAVTRYGIGMYFSMQSSPVLQGMGKQISQGAYAPLAWVALAACWAAALISFFKGKHRKRLLDKQTSLESIRAMPWREFEMLTGEAFRRQGYAIQETGLGGADGGIDLVLKKDGATTLVQCKQWRTRKVEVSVVREMFGLLVHHNAAAIKIVAVGDYTADAHRFVQGKPIELIHGDALLAMVRAVQSVKTALTEAPAASLVMHSEQQNCPECGATMIKRENRKTKRPFWGCMGYPACRGTRQIS